MAAWLEGQPASGDVTRTVADMITSARAPLIVLDAVDLAAAAAALDLAKAAGAYLDHVHPNGLAPLSEQGYLGTTHGETFVHADTILIVGPVGDDPGSSASLDRLVRKKPGLDLIRICAHNDPARTDDAETFALENMSLSETIGLLQARAQKKPVSVAQDVLEKVDALVAKLFATKYGVALFSQGTIDDLSQYALMSLINTLSGETRFSMVPFGVSPGQSELTRMAQGMTGLPAPLKFSNGRAAHDRWLYGAQAIAERGETDLAIWISSSINAPPAWISNATKTVHISGEATMTQGAAAQIQIGIAGLDHDAIIEPDELGAFINVTARSPNSDLRSAATLLQQITSHIAQIAKEAAA